MTVNQSASSMCPVADKKPSFALMNRDDGGDHALIWRARSFDEAHSSSAHNDPRGNEHLQDGDAPPAAALHSSFDAAFLASSHDPSNLFDLDDDKQDPQASWDAGELSGRKHLLQQAAVAETAEAIQPRTVRKMARRATSALGGKAPGRPQPRPPGPGLKKCWEDSTPSSAAKRRRAPLPHRKSPMRRVQSLNPAALPLAPSALTPLAARKGEPIAGAPSLQAMTPTRSGGPSSTMKSMSRWHNTGTTAASTHLETTLESGSVDTSSPTTTRFRFTSFPASLPRVNNPRDRQCPDSVRKRMSFGDMTGVNETNQSKDDDGTHNTSISSLSDGGQQQLQLAPTLPSSALEWQSRQQEVSDDLRDGGPVHAKLFPDEENFGYSDDDSTDSPVRGIVGRTRLNFNLVLSPENVKHGQKDPDGMNTLMPLDLNADLSRPYEQRRINSFPSSLSSSTHLNDVSGFGEVGAALTPSRPGQKGGPLTPGEVQLPFQLESQCSPIPGIPEKGDPLPDLHEKAGSVPYMIGDQTICQHDSLGPKHSMTAGGESRCKGEESSSSESTNGKVRRLRPMPDISAFESVAQSSRGDHSADDSATVDSKAVPLSPRLMCPPTPVRTPAWANESGAHVFFGGRQNSLITTKVLLACPSQVLEGRTSLESSVLDDESQASSRALQRGSKASALPRKGRKEDADKGLEANGLCVPIATRPSLSNASPMDLPCGPTPEGKAAALDGPAGGDLGSVISFSNDFDTLSVLGSGAFADVYKVRSKRDNRLYAVKRNRRQFRGKRDRDMALREVLSMQRLQSVCAETGTSGLGSNDKNSYSLYLLFFYRAWQEDGYFFCQTELCCRDTCREMIDSLRLKWNSAKAKYPSLLRNLSSPDGLEGSNEFDVAGRPVPNMTIWKIANDMAAGLSHIHSHGIVHLDMKPSNIFFTPNVRFGAMCKIGDFGMAGEVGTSGDGQEGDTKYLPAELLSSGVRQPSADIFSLGLTLYEIAANHHVELPSEGPRWHELRSSNAPDLSPGRESDLVDLIKLMTNPKTSKRPTADSILQNEKVKLAGQGYDTFLRDYLRDVEEFDRLEEERFALNQNEDQTPRTGPHRGGVRSPSLSMLLPSAPNLFSPSVRNLH